MLIRSRSSISRMYRGTSVDGARRVPLNHVHANAKAPGKRTIIVTSNIVSEYTETNDIAHAIHKKTPVYKSAYKY